MSDREAIGEQLGRDILDAHERFSRAMAKRLPQMDLGERERYFAMVAMLVGKLEQTDKPLRQVFHETAAELLPILMQELSGS